jgi:hypothetical protein
MNQPRKLKCEWTINVEDCSPFYNHTKEEMEEAHAETVRIFNEHVEREVTKPPYYMGENI